MLVLGIDPGTATTGYGLVSGSGSRLVMEATGVVKTAAGLDLSTRLLQIHHEVNQIIDRYQPDCMAIEELFFNQNAKTFFAVAQSRGAVILTAAQRGLPVAEYTPLQVKQAVVGYGRAEKRQIQEMVKRLLNLAAIVKPDDAADALAIAICHLHSSRLGGLV
ncbi:MAG: crossover junction endodeoxyribonuclease RuvC [Solirubrobacterales bacterium]